MIYKEELQRIYRELENRRNDLNDELSLLPGGEFFAFEKDGKRHYYQRFKKAGNRKKEQRIGIKKDPEKLEQLVRKRYVVQALQLLDENLDAFRKMLHRFSPFDEISVMEDFVKKYPELERGVFYGKENLEEWAEAYSGQSDYHPENLISTASDGTSRRSLGEILIGAKLKHYGIPYRYEAPAHPDLPYMPDFTIKRPRDGKIIYWEHFGMVTNEEYMRSNKIKLGRYEDCGIVPWENLIISYSQSDGGINEKLIDALIQGWLL